MTTPSNTPQPEQSQTTHTDARELAKAIGAEQERGLHPLSWIFIFFDSLWQFSLPIIVYLFFGPDDADIGLFKSVIVMLVIVTALFPIAHFLTYRFAIVGDEIHIRWGILNKQVRHIPLRKIHNVSLRRNVLHRMLDVAEVRLESAGSGQESEALLRVLSLEDANRLEHIIATRDDNVMVELPAPTQLVEPSVTNPVSATSQQMDTQLPPPLPNTIPPPLPVEVLHANTPKQKQTLLKLAPQDIVRYGLISNAGILLGGVLTMIFSPERVILWLQKNQLITSLGTDAWSVGTWLMVLSAVGVVIIIGGKLFSVISAFLTHHDFELTDSGEHVTVEKGLFTRDKSHVPLAKVQVWRVTESWLHRLFKRQSVNIDTAMLQGQNNQRDAGRASDELIPIAQPHELNELLNRWSGTTVADLHFTPVHPKAWRRIFFKAFVSIGLTVAVLSYWVGQWAALGLLLLPLAYYGSIKRAAFMGLMVTPHFIAWRDGWLNKQWFIAPTEHVHALSLSSTPFDRRHGMVTVIADTVGGNLFQARFRMPYVYEHVAKQAVDLMQWRCR